MLIFLLVAALTASLCSADSRPVQRLIAQDVPKKVAADARSQLGSLINVITDDLFSETLGQDNPKVLTFTDDACMSVKVLL